MSDVYDVDIARLALTAGITAPVGDSLMRLLAHDLREATRTLRKEPRFLLITSLTLALGIAAATSIFSVVNGVLLKPLPYPNADRLVNVWSAAPGLDYPQFPLSPDLFLFFQKHNSVFEDLTLFQNRRVNITESGPPEVIDASVATHSYFTTLGIAFSRGRAYGAQEDRPDGPRVAVMNCGAAKGGDIEATRAMRSSPGLQAIYQVHRVVRYGAEGNAPADMIANRDEACQGLPVVAEVAEDGTSFEVRAGWDGHSRRFVSRPASQ